MIYIYMVHVYSIYIYVETYLYRVYGVYFDVLWAYWQYVFLCTMYFYV